MIQSGDPEREGVRATRLLMKSPVCLAAASLPSKSRYVFIHFDISGGHAAARTSTCLFTPEGMRQAARTGMDRHGQARMRRTSCTEPTTNAASTSISASASQARPSRNGSGAGGGDAAGTVAAILGHVGTGGE